MAADLDFSTRGLGDVRDEIVWRPQPGPQTALLQVPSGVNEPLSARRKIYEVFFGGARGGGKTSGLLGHWLRHANNWSKHARGILFRKTFDEFEEVHNQAVTLFQRLGAEFHQGKHVWTFPDGATLRYRFLEKEKHVDKYQGRQYTWQGWEELTNWSHAGMIDKVGATLRSSDGVQCEWVGTANPGGPGHNWVKERYILPAPPYAPHFDATKKVWRIFIPSRITDNKILMANDPGYADRLRGSGPEWLVNAWLDGNWNIVAGGMFDDVWDTRRHILPPFKLPSHWRIERAFDWGSSRPFSLGWWATADGNPVKLDDGRTLHFYKGTKIRIAEYYGWDGKTPNKGLNYTDTEIARRAIQFEDVIQKTYQTRIYSGPADPSIFNIVNGRSIAAAMQVVGLQFIPAATGPNSRVTGWETMRRMLRASMKYPMEEAGLFTFSTCTQFIRTVPILPRDPTYLDDVNTDAEDHIGDETRYALTTPGHTVQMVKMSV